MIELGCEPNIVPIVKIALILGIQRGHDNEFCTRIVTVLGFQPADDVMDGPPSRYVQFLAVTYLTLPEVGCVLLP